MSCYIKRVSKREVHFMAKDGLVITITYSKQGLVIILGGGKVALLTVATLRDGQLTPVWKIPRLPLF